MKITKTLLKKHDACEEQIELFESLFPEGTEVTEEACLKADECDIDFGWACRNLLKDQDAYEATKKPFFDDYIAARNPLLDDYLTDIVPYRNAYEAAEKPLWDAYKKQQALLFYKQFNEENP